MAPRNREQLQLDETSWKWRSSTDEREQIRPVTPAEAAGILDPSETFWRDLQPWLSQCGFRLRPRFRRGWIPSWKTPGGSVVIGSSEILSEDSWGLRRPQLMDAVRIIDGLPVVLKRISNALHRFESEIHRHIASPNSPFSESLEPKNHCAPLLNILHPPDNIEALILVMPLMRKYDSPGFDTVGEVVDFFQQIFEGLQFMHKHHIAHRDCCSDNILMAANDMYPKGFHPQYQDNTLDMNKRASHLTRTERPPKYYFIDFGMSVRFQPDEPHLALPIVGADQTVPEYQNGGTLHPLDPFRTDVYLLGNFIRQEFLDGQSDPRYMVCEGRIGFEFMRSLVNDMVNPEPAKRPTMDEVVLRFEKIKSELSTGKLRSRVRSKKEILVCNIPTIIAHWHRKLRYVINDTPPIPVYRP
ncbi:kinase-like domain-containing protein [Mycena metata]|uniref:Kinase-like domain-containing protein n=1 Tax=Mycena metata TaxID=1033252 RepID=A0AAD7GQM1_9AGAR|nr:kinase-like domain-containing protein [Mycena metata]